jgi:hypothetical protein
LQISKKHLFLRPIIQTKKQKMKKLLSTLAIAAIMVSCNDSKNDDTTTPGSDTSNPAMDAAAADRKADTAILINDTAHKMIEKMPDSGTKMMDKMNDTFHSKADKMKAAEKKKP